MDMKDLSKYLRPSGASRWLECPGSAIVCAMQDLEGSSSVYAEEGTAAHKLAEECLIKGCTAAEYPNAWVALGEDNEETVKQYMLPAEMRTAVDEFLSAVRSMAGKRHIQPETRFEDILDGIGGTCDACCWGDGELQVHDLKYGRRPVSAENNPQLKLYALGALGLVEELYGEPIEKVKLVIHQPNLRYVDEWDTTPKQLKAFRAVVHKKIESIKVEIRASSLRGSVDAYNFHPSEKACFFCPAKGTCEHLQKHLLTAVREDFEDLSKVTEAGIKDATPVQIVDGDRLGTLLPLLGLFRSWCDEIYKLALTNLQAGQEVAGYKLVAGRKGRRGWTDEDAVIAKMKSMRLKNEVIYNQKLVSVAQAEKKIGKNVFAKKMLYLVQEGAEGAPEVVPETDKRSSVKSTIDEFEDISTQTEEKDNG